MCEIDGLLCGFELQTALLSFVELRVEFDDSGDFRGLWLNLVDTRGALCGCTCALIGISTRQRPLMVRLHWQFGPVYIMGVIELSSWPISYFHPRAYFCSRIIQVLYLGMCRFGFL